jgi:hypothetical protein
MWEAATNKRNGERVWERDILLYICYNIVGGIFLK